MKTLVRVNDIVGNLAIWISAGLLVYIVCHISLEIVMRSFFSASTFSMDEFVGYAIGSMTFLSLAHTFRHRKHIQVHLWRRSYDVPPPEGESLELCAARTLPYLESTLLPALEAGRNLFVAAHGNSLRSMVMAVEGLSREDVLSLEIPTGVPRVYARENDGWRRVEL